MVKIPLNAHVFYIKNPSKIPAATAEPITPATFGLGALSFVIATASGVIFVKIFNLFLKKDNKINPLIGNAGVSAVPDSARISQVVCRIIFQTYYLRDTCRIRYGRYTCITDQRIDLIIFLQEEVEYLHEDHT